MRVVLVAALLLTACAPDAQPQDLDDPTTTTFTTVFQVDVPRDVWNGEVEWDMVERCALLGLSDCPDTIVELKNSGCTVEGADRYLRLVADGEDPSEVVSGLQESGDCPALTP